MNVLMARNVYKLFDYRVNITYYLYMLLKLYTRGSKYFPSIYPVIIQDKIYIVISLVIRRNFLRCLLNRM